MKALSVAIVGAGIGGLTAALALAQRGSSVTLYEQTAQLGEIGAGINLSPNGMKVMRALNLESALLRVAAFPQAIATRDYISGQPNFEGLFDNSFLARFGAPFLSFHRADLHRVLTDAAAQSRKISLKLGYCLVGLETHSDHVVLAFANGQRLACECLVGADGVHSRVRSALYGAVGTRFTGHVAYRGMVETAKLSRGLIEPKLNVWVGPNKHLVAYPVRRGELINYVGIVEEHGWNDESWTTRADARELAQTFAGWNDTVQVLVRHTLMGECYKWALLGRDPLPAWSGARATLLGDAAHPMVPYLAQGAVMAVEDAWALAACLDLERNCGTAFKRYEAARLERTTAVQAAAWEQGQLNHAVGRNTSNEEFRGGRFADPGWIYGYDVVAAFP